MDGVIADFVGGVFAMYGKTKAEYAAALTNWPLGVTGVHPMLGVAHDDMWVRLMQEGPDWWARLPAYDYTIEFVNALNAAGTLRILTSPCAARRASRVMGGKAEWLADRFGDGFEAFAITPQKYIAAKANAILIDDDRRNCRQFAAAGGNFVLFDQPWNRSADGETGYHYSRVLEMVKRFAVYGPRGLPLFNLGDQRL